MCQCAKEMDFGVYAAIFDGEFPLGKLLSGLLGIEDTDQEPDKLHQIMCRPVGLGTMNLSETAGSAVQIVTVCSAL
uniref:hypothetical protein n=1 Tax=Clostridium sp. NkU-1 TaxID=1095009 RepID=UPI000B271E22